VTRAKRWLQHSVRGAIRPMVPNAQMATVGICFGNESIMNVSWSDLNNVQEGGDYVPRWYDHRDFRRGGDLEK
jgi:hypothetical protein